jgi:dipeptidyl aminopeptidase/acylaminoacyl peptidase
MEEWKSLIGADTVASSHISFQEMHVDCDSVFWVESRPLEKGRRALMKKKQGEVPVDLFPSMSIQSKVHEYGGGSFFVQKGLLVFVDAKTHSLYVQQGDSQPICLVKDPLKRWADFSFHPDLTHVLCVCEDHSGNEVVNYLVVFNLATKDKKIVHEGFDFYASPQTSPDGKKIAFVAWNFPHMPWEESLIKVVSWEKSEDLFSIGGVEESITQFIWTAPEKLIFTSDRSGFSNLYLWTPEGEIPLCKKDADFSCLLWVLGKKNFKPIKRGGKECLIVSFCEKAIDSLAILELETGKLQKFDLPYNVIEAIDVGSEGVYFVGGSDIHPMSLVFFNVETLERKVIVSSSKKNIDLEPFISKPQKVSARSSIDNQEIFGFFYLPRNPDFENNLPPLIIKCHSGPTSHSQPLLNWNVQFWTSRGFAFLDVNYRGSSGFGRKYREVLNHNWGVVDVQDCLDLAFFLTEKGLVNRNALFARGSSSGGYTALSLAATSPEIKGCVSLYGVTDLCELAKETHKFEKYYLDSLVGEYKKFPQRYVSRSPLNRSDQITCPVLFLHGDKDCVVPLSQAEDLQKKLSSSDLIVFQGEGHGFRHADTIQSSLEAEFAFYTKILKS